MKFHDATLRAFCITCLLLLQAGSAWSQVEIIIGTDTRSMPYPLAASHQGARTQVIYLASEIGSPYKLTALSLDITTVPGQTMSNFTIRMKHTSLSAYPSPASWESSDWTTVYQSNETITSTGWWKFTFTTPFQYNGVNNLMVDFTFDNASSSTDGLCRYFTTQGAAMRTIYKPTDGLYDDPLTWSDATPTPTRTIYMPALKLEAVSVATSKFSPNAGVFDSAQNVTVSCATPGATIHYTTNGVDPTESDPAVVSGSTVLVDHTLTLKAKAWRADLEPSAVKSAGYTLKVKTPAFNIMSGTYSSPVNVKITCSTPGAVIHYADNGVDPTESDPVIASGSTVLVDRNLTLKAKAWRPDLDPSDVKSAAYVLKVATPDFAPPAGHYAFPQSVSITCSTPSAVIRYTVNGVDPTEGDPVVSGPVTISAPVTLKARAWTTGWTESNVRSGYYGAVLILHVKPNGNDAYDGLSWATAKRTVQAGLTAAVSGDEIWVAGDAAHPYYERIMLKAGVGLYGGFSGMETDRGQRDWKTNVTILDGSKGGSVVMARLGGTSSSVIDGFTIRNGGGSFGGGIYCDNYSLTISNNTISGSTASYGGGILCSNSSPTISGNVIVGNSAHRGGGIYCGNSSPRIANNMITGNSAGNSGGGVYCEYPSSPTIVNNTIAGNSSLRGGGLSSSSSPATVNNVVAFNSSGVYVQFGLGSPAGKNNCVYGNTAYDYSGVSPGTGDISLDPLFRDATNGDYHLLWNSPCVDAGTNDGAPSTDFDGNPRPIDGNIDGFAVTDIGAYEFAPFRIKAFVIPEWIQLQPNRLILVVIPSTRTFNAAKIDPTSVLFGPGRAKEVHGKGHFIGNRLRMGPELMLHFRCGDTGIQEGDTSVPICGRLTTGEPFTATARIRVFGNGRRR